MHIACGAVALKFLGNMPNFDQRAATQNKGIFNNILQLANIAWEIVPHQYIEGVISHPLDVLSLDSQGRQGPCFKIILIDKNNDFSVLPAG
jgi:hypothetical protein